MNMKLFFTKKFIRQYRKLPQQIQETTDKQLGLLLSNPEHPSLNVKKMQGLKEIWEARITSSYRCTFQKDDESYYLRNIGTHDILKKP
ncbi:conserved hypothetical protein [Desulfamplus magnetovallimortis]|uniref:Plasmid stabilization system n=1 Tax=Desulfamplus magnetovallimortis TaxID=1246637 RepID=A0A1W1HIU9_9BACT|nr:conserved hypothetical protein [Desulfamplus magnetovallimortis]